MRNHYSYKDYNTGAILFECAADGILEADIYLLQSYGPEAAKLANIGCSIEFNSMWGR